jgi:hypothetical protein
MESFDFMMNPLFDLETKSKRPVAQTLNKEFIFSQHPLYSYHGNDLHEFRILEGKKKPDLVLGEFYDDV